MPKTEIRQLQGKEFLDILHFLSSYSFHPSPPLQDKDKWREQVGKRLGITAYGLFEETNPVAIVAETHMNQQIRGRQLGMGGVWGVATHPEARRRGYCKRLMKHLLVSIHKDDRGFSCLYPFRESFYERLGYVTFPQSKEVSFDPANLSPLLKRDFEGEVVMLPIKEGFPIYAQFLKAVQKHTHGMALLAKDDQAEARKDKSWLAIAKVKGNVVGVMTYTLQGKLVTKFTLRARRFYYTTSQGKYLLLAWIAKHVDQASEAIVFLPPFARPETWLADLNVKTKPLWIPPMGRVVDVTKLSGLSAGPGRITVQITDPLCPWNEGDWAFETIDGQLQVTPAKESEFTLSVQGLSALVYGTHDAEDFPIREWGNPSSTDQELLQSMFPYKSPYLHLFF